MSRSPNDMDPPEHVVGTGVYEELLEVTYERWPWLEDIDGVDDVLMFVADSSYGQGNRDAQADAGEYIDWLKGKVVELEEVSNGQAT